METCNTKTGKHGTQLSNCVFNNLKSLHVNLLQEQHTLFFYIVIYLLLSLIYYVAVNVDFNILTSFSGYFIQAQKVLLDYTVDSTIVTVQILIHKQYNILCTFVLCAIFLYMAIHFCWYNTIEQTALINNCCLSFWKHNDIWSQSFTSFWLTININWIWLQPLYIT